MKLLIFQKINNAIKVNNNRILLDKLVDILINSKTIENGIFRKLTLTY